MFRLTDMVKHLLILNVIFFIGSAFVGEGLASKYFNLYYFESLNFGYWQLLTYMFMHAGFQHLLFNMLGLVMFGSTLESYWGSQKFLFFYISCGVWAALIHTGVNFYHFEKGVEYLLANGFSQDQLIMLLEESKYLVAQEDIVNTLVVSKMLSVLHVPMLGASGAIYGIMVAMAFLSPESEMFPIPIQLKYFVPFLLLMDLFSGVTKFSLLGGGVAHFAHLGGALFGFIMMWYWKKNQFSGNRWN